MNLLEFNNQREQLISALAEKLGYQLDRSDIELFIPATNHVRIRSVRGVFFTNGEPQESPWGSKSSLPKNFSPLAREKQLQVGTFVVDFDDGFYRS